MTALHAVEQLHSRPLHSEDADAMADLRPFGIEVVSIKSRDSGRTWSSTLSTWLQSTVPSRAIVTALVRTSGLPEKKPRCSAASSRFRGLSNSRPSTLATESLPTTHLPGCDLLTLSAFAFASSAAICAASVIPALRLASSTSGRTTICSTPASSSIVRRMALPEARISGNRTILWRRPCAVVAPRWGTAQLGSCPTAVSDIPMNHPRAPDSIPSL